MPDEVYSVIMNMQAPLARGARRGIRSIPRVSSGFRMASGGGSMPRLDVASNDLRMPEVNVPSMPQVASVGTNASSNVSFARVAPQSASMASPKAEPVVNTSIKSSDSPLQSQSNSTISNAQASPSNNGNNLSNGGTPTVPVRPSSIRDQRATPQPTPQPTPQVTQKQPTPQPTPQVTQKQPEVTNTTPEGNPIQPNYKNPKGTINGLPYDRKKTATQLPEAKKNAPGTINGEKPIREKVLGLPKAQKNAPGTINGETPLREKTSIANMTTPEGKPIQPNYKNPKGTINGLPGDFRDKPTEIAKVDKTKRMTYEIIPKADPTESDKQAQMIAKEEEQNRRIEEYRKFKRNRPTMKEIQGD